MRKLTFFLTLTLLIAACNGISTRQKGEGLATAMDDYIASLRWGRFDSAKAFHLGKDDTQPQIDSSQLEYIRVTGHTVKKKTINEALDEAVVEIEIEYYNNEYGTLKKIIIKQAWWYHDKANSWYLSSDFPEF